jgi:hypothetical protein
MLRCVLIVAGGEQSEAEVIAQNTVQLIGYEHTRRHHRF